MDKLLLATPPVASIGRIQELEQTLRCIGDFALNIHDEFYHTPLIKMVNEAGNITCPKCGYYICHCQEAANPASTPTATM
jgi:hypothetical protein